MNSDHDRHFSVEMATLSYQEVNKNGGNAILSIHPDLEHGHTEPLVIEDIYNFADSIVNGEPSYMKITNTDTVNRTVEILVPEGISIASADVYTTEDTNLNYKPAAGSPILATVWSNNGSAEITDNIIKYTIPEKTGLYYINITDNLGRTVSTGLINN